MQTIPTGVPTCIDYLQTPLSVQSSKKTLKFVKWKPFNDFSIFFIFNTM